MHGLPSIPLPQTPLSSTSMGLDAGGSLTQLAPGLPLPLEPTSEANPLAAGFEAMLSETLQLEQTAQQNVETALTGGDITQAEVLAAVKKADLSLRLLMQIRNKTLAAYNEIQQMRF